MDVTMVCAEMIMAGTGACREAAGLQGGSTTWERHHDIRTGRAVIGL